MFQQRGLARAVRPDKTDAVAALDADREVAHDRRVAEALRNAFASATSLPDRSASLTAIFTLPSAPRCSRKSLRICWSKPTRRILRLRRPRRRSVSSAPRRRSCGRACAALFSSSSRTWSRHSSNDANPCSMRRVTPRSSQTVARESFSRKRRSWLMSTSAERDDASFALQPFDRRQVEMIGRLVEQQNVGLGRQHACERRTPRFAAGKPRGVFARRSGQAARAGSARDAGRRRARVPPRRTPSVVAKPARSGSCARYRMVAPGWAKRVPRSAFHRAGGDLQQCRFARAVAADQADALAFADGKLGAFEQRRAAEGEVDVLQGEKRWRHARRLRRCDAVSKPWRAFPNPTLPARRQ